MDTFTQREKDKVNIICSLCRLHICRSSNHSSFIRFMIYFKSFRCCSGNVFSDSGVYTFDGKCFTTQGAMNYSIFFPGF